MLLCCVLLPNFIGPKVIKKSWRYPAFLFYSWLPITLLMKYRELQRKCATSQLPP